MLDAAVSRALLERVAAGEVPQTLRLWRPGRVVGFGKRDLIHPRFADALKAAHERGFQTIERLGGGRAAAYHEATLVFSQAMPDPDPKPGIDARFDAFAGIGAAALRRLGVDARVGEVPGEYCPGSHSVNAAGRRKLIGVGQRLVGGAAHVGAVVVVDGADVVNGVLEPVYAALELSFDPATTGSVAGEAPGATLAIVRDAVLAEYGDRYELEPGELDEATLALARRLVTEVP